MCDANASHLWLPAALRRGHARIATRSVAGGGLELSLRRDKPAGSVGLPAALCGGRARIATRSVAGGKPKFRRLPHKAAGSLWLRPTCRPGSRPDFRLSLSRAQRTKLRSTQARKKPQFRSQSSKPPRRGPSVRRPRAVACRPCRRLRRFTFGLGSFRFRPSFGAWVLRASDFPRPSQLPPRR